jgi:AraC family transcriptional regulator
MLFSLEKGIFFCYKRSSPLLSGKDVSTLDDILSSVPERTVRQGGPFTPAVLPPSSRKICETKGASKMDYKTAVLTGKSFIEENLLEDLSPYTIASAAGYSVFHYCRLFRECTGESLMGYVRRLRLVLSVREIEQGRPLSDIAVKYGFETVSGFSRAYKRQFGSFPVSRKTA